MVSAITKRQGGAIAGSSVGWSRSQIELIKHQLINRGGPNDPGTSDEELEYFWNVCKSTGLSPILRQIYAIRRWDKSSNGFKMSIQTGIGGMRAIASRTGQYAGSDEPQFDEGINLYQHTQTGRGKPVVARVTVYRLVGGTRCAFTGTAAWDEFSQSSPMWSRMPYNQLAKCAESQALSKAFPEETAAIEFTTSDELPNTGAGSRSSGSDYLDSEAWGKFTVAIAQAARSGDQKAIAKYVALAYQRIEEGVFPVAAQSSIEREETAAYEILSSGAVGAAASQDAIEVEAV